MTVLRKMLLGAGAVVLLLLAAGAGFALASAIRVGSTSGSMLARAGASASLAPEVSAGQVPAGAGGMGVQDGSFPVNAATKGVAAPSRGDAMVVRTGAMDVRVKSARAALATLRLRIAAAGGEIQSLTYEAGSGQPEPVALAEAGSPAQPAGPEKAVVTIRVPAEKLARLTAQAAGLGTVISQSAGQQDVTQQYVDLAARLKNLKAEEARLRTFFAKATRVSDMLSIEAQLSRVQGEIEAMQAQLDLLKNQVALSTLSVTLSEPGAIVSPAGATWGLGEAVTAGIRSAVAVIDGAIFILIAALPIIGLGVAVWFVVWVLLKRKSRHAEREQGGIGPDPLAEES